MSNKTAVIGLELSAALDEKDKRITELEELLRESWERFKRYEMDVCGETEAPLEHKQYMRKMSKALEDK